MPNDNETIISLDNLSRFKNNLDVQIGAKADADAVYGKNETIQLLNAKQNTLTQTQLNNINNVPNKQDALTADQLANADASGIPNNVIDVLLGDVVVSPTLGNNSWETIKAVAEAGLTGGYWAVGDTKTDVGTDGVTRTFRVVDIYNAYPGRVVFEQVECDYLSNIDSSWNIRNNVDDDSYSNNYSISNMRNTILPHVLTQYSTMLQSCISNTTYKVAKNGKGEVLLELTDKLFLAAEKELHGTRVLSREIEFNALSMWAYYSANDSNSYRIKKITGRVSDYPWWERSPANQTHMVCNVTDAGGLSATSYDYGMGISPAFSF